MDVDLDFGRGLLDEIALEGLDGITLQMLWQRLSDRPKFGIKVDEHSKKFFWNCISLHKDIQMYCLPEPRPFAPIINRYDFIDPELGVVMESPNDVEDPYPIFCVKDGDIRGSCETYETRECVTSQVRNGNDLLLSLSEAEDKWGDCLVLVASPKVRLLALIGTTTNPLIDLSIESYCLLERIGRSRYLGEVTQGAGGLLSTKATFCKQLHYYRKKLSLKGLITKQMHYMKTRKGNTMNGSLFHLTRFYVLRKTKMAAIMKKLCDILKEKPKQREVSKKLRDELNIKERTFKKLFYRPFQKWVRMDSLPFHELYPDAPRKDCFTMNGHEKIAKVVQLLKHCDEEDDEEEEDMVEEEKKALPLNTHFDFSRIRTFVPLVIQVYRLVLESGSVGVSSSDVGRVMTLPRLDTRTLLRILLKRGQVTTFLQDRGRQKVTKYIATEFANQNEAYSSLQGQDVMNVVAVASEPAEQPEPAKRKASDSDADWEPEEIPKKKKKASNKTATPSPVEMEVEDEPIPSPLTPNKSPSESNFQNIVSHVLEVQNQSHFTGKAPKLISISDQPTCPSPYSGSSQLTYRKLKRSNLIIDYLKTERFTTMSDLQKYISEKEKEEGYNFKLDKKSTQRLVYSLFNSKKIKIFKAVLKLEKEQTEIEFICDKSLEAADPHIQVAIEHAKFKHFGVSKETLVKKSSPFPEPELNVPECKSESQKNKPVSASKMLDKEEIIEKYPPMTPKFCRTKALHLFLYYLVHSHREGDPASNKQCVYHDSMTWKRFVPPLPNYGKDGWCYLADIYSRMPLSLFVKIVNFRHGVPGLNQFLGDEEKAHYLIKYLPQDLRNNLLNNRKYLFSTTDVIKLLCYMGLVSMGPQVGKQKDQVFLFIHRRGSMKDTTISSSGYIHVQSDIEYESKLFEFKSECDLENYWLELESVCFHTPLGKFSAAVGKTISITDPNYKPGLIESTNNKSFDQVVDCGAIPGDGLGAGGFDSSLFLHSRRNWQNSSGMKPQAVLRDKMNIGAEMHSIQDLLKQKEISKPDQKSRLHRLAKSNEMQLQKENKLKMGKGGSPKAMPKMSAEAIKTKKKTKVRTIKMRTVKKRCPYYDEKDKAAMEKLDKTRCDWSTQEDSFLLLCKVASSFLEPYNTKSLVVPHTVVRDLLYEHVPGLSADKSSRACQRRLRYMMMTPDTVKNVRVFLGEARQDSELVKEFDKMKPPRNKVEMWEEMFTAVLKKLQVKFTQPTSHRCVSQKLPDTLEEFWARYEYVPEYDLTNPKRIYADPTDSESIKKFVLNSLVLSAMAILNDGAQWSYLLHKLYQEYSESVLQSVVTHLRRERVIAVKKKSHRSDIQRSLRSTCPYKFSITYLNALNTKVPSKIFKESRELLNSLKSLSAEAGVELTGDVPPGYAAGVLSLVMMDQLTVHTKIPDQIILFDCTLSKEAKSNIVERMINTLSDQESKELTELLGSECASESSTSKKSLFFSAPTKEEMIMDIENDSMQSNPLSDRNFQNASRFALYLLRRELSQPPIEKVQHSQDYIVLNSCRVFCRLKSANKDFVLPTTPVDLILKKNDKGPVTLHCISNERIGLSEQQILEVSSLLKSYVSPDSFKVKTNYGELFAQLYNSYSPQTLQDAQGIFVFLFQHGEVGITEQRLWRAFCKLSGELQLFEHLSLLRKNDYVVRVGVVHFQYVCCCFARNWVLKSFHIPGIFSKMSPCLQESAVAEEQLGRNSIAIVSDFESAVESGSSKAVETVVPAIPDPHSCISCLKERIASDKREEGSKGIVPVATFDTTATEVNFIARTWRNPDGTLNNTVFFELLSTVLSHIISFPAVSSAQVCEHFLQVMPPVQTLELIEVLEKASCIYKYYTKAMKKCSLFSPQSVIMVAEDPEPNDLDHLEPFPDSLVKVAMLRDAL